MGAVISSITGGTCSFCGIPDSLDGSVESTLVEMANIPSPNPMIQAINLLQGINSNENTITPEQREQLLTLLSKFISSPSDAKTHPPKVAQCVPPSNPSEPVQCVETSNPPEVVEAPSTIPSEQITTVIGLLQTLVQQTNSQPTIMATSNKE